MFVVDKLKNIFWRKKMANPLEPVAESVRQRLISELGFGVDPDDKNGVYKDISDNYGMVFFHDEESPLTFGFYHYNDKNFSPEQRKWLTEVFGRREFTEDFDDFCDWGDQWICKRFKHQGWTNEDIINFLVGRYKWLEQTVQYLEIK
jgi:hypothetical protein